MEAFGNHFKDAYNLFREKKFDEALEKLSEAEKHYKPNNIEGGLTVEDVYILRASIYLFKEENDKAREMFEKALKANPFSPEACLGLGKLFFYEGAVEEAKTMLEWAVKNSSDEENENIKANLKVINETLGLPPEHNRLFMSDEELEAESGQEDDSNADPLDEAFDLFTKKNYKEALVKLDKAKTEYLEKLASVENFKGFNFLALNEVDTAESCFEQALKLNKNSSQAYAGLGEIAFLRENDVKARQMFEKSLKINPANEFAKAGMEKVASDGKLPDDLPEKHSMFESYIQDAYADFSNKKYEDALKKLNKCESLMVELGLESSEMIASFKNFKGFNLLGLGETEQAKEQFELALQEEPNSSQAAAGLGEVLFLNNEDEKAKTMFEVAVKANPQNQFAVAGLEKVKKSLSES